jgi:hypothetical protein
MSGMSKNLIKALVRLYHTIPPGRRVWLGRLIFPLRMIVRGFANMYFEVYLIDGNERQFYCITSSKPDLDFIGQFCSNAKITKTGELYAWNLKGFSRTHTTLIIDMHKYLSPFFSDGLITVPWVRQVLDLEIPMEALLRHIRERKKIAAYQAEISTDYRDIKKFYETVYVPYTMKRYANASIMDFETFNEYVLGKSGELLIVKKNGLPVGGACCVLVQNTYYWRINGLIDEGLLNDGAMAAIYYFSIMRAKERKALTMDMGWSRASISDGVLSYKRKWQAKIHPAISNRVMYLKNLKKEGLIVVEEKKLKVLVYSEKNAGLSPYADSGLELKLVEPES